MSLYLGIDASTQSVSALVFDGVAGTIVAESSVNFGADLPQYEAPQGFITDGLDGEVHSDPKMWLEALDLCLSRLKDQSVDMGAIIAVSGAGQQHGTVYLNAEGLSRLQKLDASSPLANQFSSGFSRETSPIWMDTSTTEQCRAIEKAIGGAVPVCEKSGSIAIERFSGPQIRRFYEESPTGFAETARIHLVSSFMASILSGTDAPIDHGDGAGMNLLNLESLDWDDDLLEATAPGLREKLPSTVPSQTTLGPVAPYFVEQYGLNPEAVVVAFTGDNPSSLVGTNGAEPGKLVISLGTSDTFFAAMPEPLTDPAGCGHVFGNPFGGFMTLQCFVNGSLAREKVRDALGMDWTAFAKAIDETDPGNSGKCMLPFFSPEISPRVDISKPVVSDALGSHWQSDPASARACVEGQFINMRLSTEWMQLKPEVIYLTGGASMNDSIARIAANVFQIEIKRLEVSSSVAVGAALRAGICHGDLDTNTVDKFFAQSISGEGIEPDVRTADVYDDLTTTVRQMRVSMSR